MSLAKKDSLLLILVALLATTAVRWLFLQQFGFWGNIINNDAHEYTTIAQNLLQGHGFAWQQGEPTAFRPFGYPFFLALISFFTKGEPVQTIQFWQLWAATFTLLPLYEVAKPLKQPALLLAFLFITIHPVLLYVNGLIAPETISLLTQSSFLWALWKIHHRPNPLHILSFIITGCLTIWLRPEAILLVLFAPFTLWKSQTNKHTPSRLIVATFATLLIATIPPTLRSAILWHQLLPFPTIGGVTFWGANNPHAQGGWLYPSVENWTNLTTSFPEYGMRGWATLDEIASQKQFYAESWAWIKTHPTDWLKLLPQKMIRSWIISYADQSRNATIPAGVQWANLGFGLLALYGLYALWWQKQRLTISIYLLPLSGWVIKTVLFYGSARQTATILPIACILAAHTLVEVGSRIKERVQQIS